jgi:hypothetical protein
VPVDPSSPEWASTESFALMFRDAATALADADPAGLVTTGAPADEYDVEAAQIVRLVLAEAQSWEDVVRIAADVLAHYLGGGRYDDRLGRFADAVWRRSQELQQDG